MLIDQKMFLGGNTPNTPILYNTLLLKSPKSKLKYVGNDWGRKYDAF